ncbi:MAG: FliH/SctL family protein [Vulcanimicrobiaceae bacterium]
MPEAFVPLGDWLRPPIVQGGVEPDLRDDAAARDAASAVCEALPQRGSDAPFVETQTQLLRDVRLFRARVAECVEACAQRLLVDLAADVLGRELSSSPAQLAAIVARTLARIGDEIPLRLRVHPDERFATTYGGVPVEGDERLKRGDLLIDLRDGEVDAGLGVRLAEVLAELGA